MKLYFLKRVIVVAFTALLCSLSLGSVNGQTELPELGGGLDEELLLFEDIPSVYGASKYEQKVTEAPASVSIVTADEIRKYGYRELPDILRSVRGFFTTYDRSYHYLGVRGFGRPGDYNSRILLLVNGHRLNDNIYDSAAIGNEFVLDVDLIERVEVIRGPSSSLYGTNAFFGVINVVTKRGRDLQTAELSGEVRSHETYKGRASYGNRFDNGVEVLFSASGLESDGDDHYYEEFDDPATNNGKAEGVDDEEYRRYFASLAFHDLRLEASYSKRQKGIPTGAWGTEFNDPGNDTDDARGYLDLLYQRELGSRSDITARLFYDKYEYDGDYMYDYGVPGSPDVVDLEDFGHGEWWGAELKLTGSLSMHKLTLGGEYRATIDAHQKTFDPYDTYLDDHQSDDIWAVYVQDEIALGDDLILSLGVRHDEYDTFGGTTNPRAGLIYMPTEKTTVKLLYGEAFRAPNAYELYYHDGDFTQKAPGDLDPETIKTAELVLEQYIGGHLRGVASVYHYKVEDLIEQTTDPADGLLVFVNAGEVEASGLELELEGKWPGGWEGRISYAYQDTEDEETGDRLTNSPKHLANLNLIAPLGLDTYFAGLEVIYVDDRKTVQDTTAGDYAIANLTLFARDLFGGLDLSGSVYNVFDEEYGDPGGEELLQDTIEQDGRTYRLKLDYRF